MKCHGAEKQKGGLRLDSREAALKGGDTGPALVPGNPKDSLYAGAARGERSTMPPKEKLSAIPMSRVENVDRRRRAVAAPQRARGPSMPPGERLGDAWNDPRNPIVRIFGGNGSTSGRSNHWCSAQPPVAIRER